MAYTPSSSSLMLIPPTLPGEGLTPEEEARRRLQAERDQEAQQAESENTAVLVPPEIPDSPPPSEPSAGSAPAAPSRQASRAGSDGTLQAERDYETAVADDERSQGAHPEAFPSNPAAIPFNAFDLFAKASEDPKSPPLGPAGTLTERQAQVTRNQMGMGRRGPIQDPGTMVRDTLTEMLTPHAPNPDDPMDWLNGIPMAMGPALAVRGGNPIMRALLGLMGQEVVDVGENVARAARPVGEAIGRAEAQFAQNERPVASGPKLLPRLGDDASKQVQRLDSELERLGADIENHPAGTPEWQATLDRIEQTQAQRNALAGSTAHVPNLQSEIDALNEAILDNPASRALEIMPRSGNFKGEVPETVTVAQFRKVMRHNPRSHLTKNGRIEWHIAIDEMADEAGMSTDEFNDAMRQLMKDRQRVEGLKEQLRQADAEARMLRAPEIPTESPNSLRVVDVGGRQDTWTGGFADAEPAVEHLKQLGYDANLKMEEEPSQFGRSPRRIYSIETNASDEAVNEAQKWRFTREYQEHQLQENPAYARWVAQQAGPPVPSGETTAGNIQSGMGIGETPQQGGLFDNLRGEGQTQPLAEAAPVRQAVPEGQAELPIGEPTVIKRPWEMSPDELDAAIDEARLAEKEADVRALGVDGAAEWNRLQRIANRSIYTDAQQAVADAAQTEIDRLSAAFTPEQNRLLFGIGDDSPTADELRDFQDAIGSLDYESPEALGDSLKWALTAVDPKLSPEEQGRKAQLAYAQLRYGMEQAREAGFDLKAVSDAAVRGAGNRFTDLNDALYMLQDFLPNAKTAERQAQAVTPPAQALSEPPTNGVADASVLPQNPQVSPTAQTPQPNAGVATASAPTPSDRRASFIEQGRMADLSGDRDGAFVKFVMATEADPSNEEAWLWRAATAGDESEKRRSLEQALRINPASARAQAMLDNLTPPAPPALPTPGQSPNLNAALQAAGAPPLPPPNAPGGRPQAAAAGGGIGPRRPAGTPPGTPPVPAPATALPKFSPPVERGLALAHDITGIDEPMLRYAVAQAQQVANVPGQVRSFFNTVGSIVNEALSRHPDVQSSYVSATRYNQAQAQRRSAEVVLAERMVHEAFGPEAMAGGKVPDLVARYVGNQQMNDYIGTAWHVLQRASDYDLTPLQRRAVNEWKQIADDDLHFTQQSLKIPIGEVADVYVAHAFKDPDAASAALMAGAGSVGNRGVPGVARNRNLSVEDYIKFAEKHGLEIETNLSTLLAKRLAATAKLRTNGIFLEELAKKTGGKKLPPFTGPQIATPNIVRNGAQAWQFPKDIADQIAALTRQSDNSALAKGVDEAVDLARGTLLNLDFSVGGGRQAFLGFLTDPIGYGKSMKNSWNLATDSEFGWLKWYNQNTERLADASQHGLNLSSLNITDVATALPGEAPPFFERGRYNPIRALNDLQFKMIMPEMKLGRYETVFEALKLARDNKGVDAMINRLPVFGQINRKLGGRLYTMTDDELKNVAAEAANNMLGGIEWAKVGHAPGRDASGILRKVMVLTEGWTRAQMGLLTRAAQANPEGYVARRLLMSEVAMTSGIATGLSLALSGQLPEYDPRSNEWLDVKTPWGYVQILPHKSVLQFAIKGLAGNKPGEYGSDQSALAQRWDALTHFASGRVGQLPRVAGELYSGKDYYGDPITDYPQYLAQTFSPIIAGRVLRDLQQDREPTGIAVRTAEEFLGFSGRPYPKSKPGGNVVQGLPEYNTRHETVAEYIGGDDPEKVKALKLYAKLDKQYDQLTFDSGIETANKTVGAQLDSLKAKIDQQYGEETLKDYRKAIKQVEDGMVQETPALKAYLESLGKTFKEPTPTMTPTPTKTPTLEPTPTVGGPTATATSTKVPVPANTPKANATWTKDYSNDQIGARMADAWGRRGADGKPLLYDQLSSFERHAVDDFTDKLDSLALASPEKKEWRAIQSGATKEAILLQALQQFYGGQWPAPPQPSPTRTATPRSTATPTSTGTATRTATPDAYRELQSRTPTPVGTR